MARIDRSASSDDQADLERLHAIGSFFAGSPERTLSVATGLQHVSRVVESRVQGTSMGATLPDGSSIRIQLWRATGYRPGEVVACLIGAKLVTHRVVYAGTRRRHAAVLITRGDDELLPDPPVDVRSVVGRVVAVESRGLWIPLPEPLPDSLARRTIAGGILAAIAALSCINANWARGALAALSRWRDRLYPLRRWIGAARSVPPTR